MVALAPLPVSQPTEDTRILHYNFIPLVIAKEVTVTFHMSKVTTRRGLTVAPKYL